jgi:flagellar motility protein MotE (MotC chaperone)
MKLKDLIGISLVSIFLFPVILIAIMLAAGVVHIEFGNGKDKERLKETFAPPSDAQQEELEARQLKAFKAMESKEQDVKAKEAEVSREIERLEALKQETGKAREEIAAERKRIEDLVGRNSDLQDKQIASLAEVYGGMRPEEAAPILLSLDDAMVVRIMRKIPEARSTSKLLAALAALDVKRAAHITTLLGGQGKGRTPTSAPRGGDAPAAPADSGKSGPQSKA